MFRRKHSTHDDKENEAAQQEAKVNELKIALGPLSGRSLQFCDDACIRRYLEARNWNAEKAKKMLEETLKWRTTYKPEDIRWHEVASEGETGKVYRANFRDKEGRTVLVLRPGKQNTSSHDNQLRHLVYLIENAILNLPEGQEQMVWLIDFSGWSLSLSVPVKTARDSINILQNHYPERLSAAFLYNPPRIFGTFWKRGINITLVAKDAGKGENNIKRTKQHFFQCLVQDKASTDFCLRINVSIIQTPPNTPTTTFPFANSVKKAQIDKCCFLPLIW